MSIETADALMSIFGFKRKATIRGNVIEPRFEQQCDICGDYHEGEISRSCETGDGE